jgi:hypothetical protein
VNKRLLNNTGSRTLPARKDEAGRGGMLGGRIEGRPSVATTRFGGLCRSDRARETHAPHERMLRAARYRLHTETAVTQGRQPARHETKPLPALHDAACDCSHSARPVLVTQRRRQAEVSDALASPSFYITGTARTATGMQTTG